MQDENSNVMNEPEVEYEDLSGALMEKPFNPAEIDITTKPLTVDILIKRLKANPVEIDLSPAFQRKSDLWDKKKQSQLIESILIQFPLPSFYFDGSNNDKWLVVDGLQRLSAIRNYVIIKDLKLTGLEFLKKLEGLGFDDLPRNLQRQIEETQIIAYIINAGTPDDVKFNIFSRINRGGLILNSQEIRHALNQGVATSFVDSLVDTADFQEMVGKNIKTDRMLDKEFITRFIAFMVRPVSEYKPDLDSYLNSMLAVLKSLSENERTQIKINFIEAMKLARDIFGENTFRKISKYDNKKKPINKALFEVWSVSFARLSNSERTELRNKKEFLYNYFVELIDSNDGQFVYSISTATGNKTNVFNRYSAIDQIIKKTLAS